MLDLGDPVPLGVTVRAPDGTPADAGSVTCTVTLPDGTTATPTVAHDGTGLYSATYTPTLSGLHAVRWVATAPNASAFTDTFLVTPAVSTVVSMAGLRLHLGVSTSTTDEQLRRIAGVATDLAERYTGRSWRRTPIVETHDGGLCALVLRRTPVASVTSVVESGTTLATGWVLDSGAGILYRGTTTSEQAWACGRQNVVITYVAGGDVPETVRHAVLELARHLWDTQRGGSQLPRQAGAGDDWDPRAGFSMPRRVVELLDHHRAPGIG